MRLTRGSSSARSDLPHGCTADARILRGVLVPSWAFFHPHAACTNLARQPGLSLVISCPPLPAPLFYVLPLQAYPIRSAPSLTPVLPRGTYTSEDSLLVAAAKR
eukprot:357163-Chlamydomonas_euryale.AAC.6